MGPHVFYLFGGMLRRIAAKTLPSKRPMDNLELGPDVPKEEEFAFANMGAESMANAIYFPRRFSEYFDKYVLFKGHPKHKKRFLSNMDRFFRKLTTLNGGKQLLLKSPFNTGRIDAILELYPDARFIHIHRDPLEVFCSNEKLYESVLPELAFHHVENHEMENHVLYTYKQTMDSFLRSRNNLSPRQLFDLSYSDFVSNPVYWLEKAYAQLELSGFETARGFFESEAQRYENYKRNNPVVDDKRKNTVDQHWSATYRMIKND